MKNSRLMGQEELVLQTAPEENGKAALAMVLAYFGKQVTMQEMGGPIRNAAELAASAQERGLAVRGLRMTADEVAKAPLPLIAHWRFRSFVVVTKVRGNRVWLSSPEEGFLTLSRREFQEGFTGVALCFALPGQRAAEEEPEESAQEAEKSGKPEKSRNRKRAGREANRPRPSVERTRRKHGEKGGAAGVLPPAGLALLGAAQLFLAGGYGLLAILCRRLATTLSSPQHRSLTGLCLLMAGLLVCQGAAGLFQLWLIRRGREKERWEMHQKLEGQMEEVNPARFRHVQPFRLIQGGKAYRSIPDARARQLFCLTRLCTGCICLLWMGVQDVGAFAAAVLAAAIYGLACAGQMRSLWGEKQRECLHRFSAQALAGADLSRREEGKMQGKNIALWQNWISQEASLPLTQAKGRMEEGRYLSAAFLLLLVFGASLAGMLTGRTGTADLLGCMAMAAAAASAMGALPEYLSARMEEKGAGADIALVFPRENPMEGPYEGRQAQSITLQNVSVQPEGAETPVRGITFTLRRGEVLGVLAEEPVGRALAQVLSGLQPPLQGEVYLDSRDMARENSQDVFHNVMLLGEGIPFPQGTVRENIAAQKEDISDQAVAEAASQALLHESILGHGAGYDTPARDLSQGERVLLEFARAFARGTPFLICPGLTRLLDRHTEEMLLSHLRHAGVGIVLLTQDRRILSRCDIACRIEKGRMTQRERGELVEEEEDAYGN